MTTRTRCVCRLRSIITVILERTAVCNYLHYGRGSYFNDVISSTSETDYRDAARTGNSASSSTEHEWSDRKLRFVCVTRTERTFISKWSTCNN